MPTYEYACSDCGEHLEVVQSFSDEPLTTCPHCGGPLRKVFGSVGIVLKGSGFYRTDSRSGAKPARTTKKDAEPAAASSSNGSTDASSSTADKGTGTASAGETSGTSKSAAAS